MNYDIRKFNLGDVEGIVTLFNKHCKNELVYSPWSEDMFKTKFIKNPNFSSECTYVVCYEKEIIGFGSGLYKKNYLPNEDESKSPGFITMIIVSKEYRRIGIGSKLLNLIEEQLLKTKTRLECSFHNPIKLEWIVETKNNHLHPNAPGVEYPSPAYEFFLKHGYIPAAKQNSYHINLERFTLSEEIKNRIELLNKKGIIFTFFNKDIHTYKDLFAKLGNNSWEDEIIKASYNELMIPVLTPIYNNQAIGFTGPLIVENNGRGYFAGIGIHPNFRSYGVGKALFFLLCHHLQQLGAKYMTLFTGEDNPARNMYEASGFTIVKSWYVMRKNI